jgi:hypothetical protein
MAKGASGKASSPRSAPKSPAGPQSKLTPGKTLMEMIREVRERQIAASAPMPMGAVLKSVSPFTGMKIISEIILKPKATPMSDIVEAQPAESGGAGDGDDFPEHEPEKPHPKPEMIVRGNRLPQPNAFKELRRAHAADNQLQAEATKVLDRIMAIKGGRKALNQLRSLTAMLQPQMQGPQQKVGRQPRFYMQLNLQKAAALLSQAPKPSSRIHKDAKQLPGMRQALRPGAMPGSPAGAGAGAPGVGGGPK